MLLADKGLRNDAVGIFFVIQKRDGGSREKTAQNAGFF